MSVSHSPKLLSSHLSVAACTHLYSSTDTWALELSTIGICVCIASGHLGGGWVEQQIRANNYLSLTPYQMDWTHRVRWQLMHSLPLLLSHDVFDRNSSMLGHKTDVSTSVSHYHFCCILSHICAVSPVWLYLRSSKELNSWQDWNISKNICGDFALLLRTITEVSLDIPRGFALGAILVIGILFRK